MENKKQKKKGWRRYRHTAVRNILYFTLGLYTKLKYHIKIDKFKEQGKRAYLVLFNHQTAFDQFFVGMAFKGAVYYVASEDLFSNGFVSSLIKYLVNPIPIKKQSTDLKAIMTCIRVAREGGTIAMAPEGNRTYSGRTCYMSPSVSALAKKMKLPIALYRIEGGYYVHPRWSDKVRKGKMRGYVSRVIEPEEYETMTDAELFSIIERELYVDEGGICSTPLKGKNMAKGLERAFYYCPKCGVSSFSTEGDRAVCNACGWTATLGNDHSLKCPEGYEHIDTLGKWYDEQSRAMLALDLTAMDKTKSLGTESEVDLIRVIPYEKKETLIEKAKMTLYPDRITVSGAEEREFFFDKADSLAVLGRNKVNIYTNGEIYQLKGKPSFSGLKLVNTYYSYRGRLKEENNEFLGL